ncbi:MAG: DUF4405 domain-containing protein [Tepidisphaerales bacterium]
MWKPLKTGGVLFWTDVFIFLAMLAVTVTGGILKWGVPHGGGGMRRAGQQLFLGLSRHDWGEVHFYLALALIAGVALHLLSHAGWVWTSVKKRILAPIGLVRVAT